MKALCMVAGTLVTLYGVWHVLLVYAFSMTMGHDLPDAARDAAQWRFLAREASTIGFGVVLVVVGVLLAISKPRPRT